MSQKISPQAIEKATGKPWELWLDFFESIDASNLTHKEIAQKAFSDGGAPGWWAQMVTVAYEQHIGRRLPGQDCDGEFAVSASKTVEGTIDSALEQWIKFAGTRTEFSDISISRPGQISTTDKWRYWRCGLADGSRLNVNIYQKSPAKASVGIQHEKLESSEQVEHWRTYWKDFLRQL